MGDDDMSIRVIVEYIAAKVVIWTITKYPVLYMTAGKLIYAN
jgi:hypothetical protein